MTKTWQPGEIGLGGLEFKNAGRIVVEQPHWTIGVMIGDVRNGHAGLELPYEFDLAKEFSLIFEELRTLVECRLASQDGRLARAMLVTAPRSISLHRYRPLREKSGWAKAADFVEIA